MVIWRKARVLPNTANVVWFHIVTSLPRNFLRSSGFRHCERSEAILINKEITSLRSWRPFGSDCGACSGELKPRVQRGGSEESTWDCFVTSFLATTLSVCFGSASQPLTLLAMTRNNITVSGDCPDLLRSYPPSRIGTCDFVSRSQKNFKIWFDHACHNRVYFQVRSLRSQLARPGATSE